MKTIKEHCNVLSADLLLVLQCMLSGLQAVLQVGFLCSLGSLCREQHLCLCLQLRRNQYKEAVIFIIN